MKLFATTDDKFAALGYTKMRDDEFMVRYEKKADGFKYKKRIDILCKSSGHHIVQNYDPDLGDVKNIGNTCVGLQYEELKLCMKKMKEKGWS